MSRRFTGSLDTAVIKTDKILDPHRLVARCAFVVARVQQELNKYKG